MPRKKTQPEKEQEQNDSKDFIIMTPTPTIEKKIDNNFNAEDLGNKWLEQAMRDYNIENKQSSIYLEDKGTYMEPTVDLLNRLAEHPQDSLEKILQINGLIARFCNIDDIIGMTIDAIRTNLSTEYRLSFKSVEGRNKNKKAEKAKEIITDFNEEIKTKLLIAKCIPRAYQEGTVIMYLRKDASGNYVVDTFPLGVALLSPYLVGSEPVVLVDMSELKQRLQKAGFKTKQGKNMFFPTIEEEIKNNYPESVYEAFINKEPYAKLDIRYSGVLRVGDNGRKYGVSPLFRSLGCSLILQGFYRSDEQNSKARARKILSQILDPVVLGPMGDKNPLQQLAFSHKELLSAYRQSQNTGGAVIYTAPPYVKSLAFVESNGELMDVKNIIYHRNRELSTLGIGFLTLEGTSSVSTANISLSQLMRNINSIGEQLEDIILKFYRQVLTDNEIDPSLAPNISIIDSEAMDLEMRVTIAGMLYSQFNASLKTSLELLNIPFEEEVSRRKAEIEMGLDDIFKPHLSSYTTGNGDSGNESGRPKGEENNKQDYDTEYNKNRE